MANRAIDCDRRAPLSNVDSADDLVPVTKSDTNDIWGNTYSAANSRPCRGLLVGTAGTATVITAAGNTRTSIPLQAGYNPIRVTQIKNTGGASDIWAIPH